jgi:hypothetical protein
MAAVLGENRAQDNGCKTTAARQRDRDNGSLLEPDGMHPALHSWRDDLPATFVRWLAYVGGVFVLSIATARVFQSQPAMTAITPVHHSEWIEIERPFPAFALAIPEAADVPSHYAIYRHIDGGGRKDVLSLGEPDTIAPYLQVEIYRPGREIGRFADAKLAIAVAAAALGPTSLRRDDGPLESKLGPLDVFSFDTAKGSSRHCLGFVRTYDDPRLQLSGWFCRGGEPVQRSTLACALDRLTLLSAGSEPKVGALFAQAELHRSFCGQRDPILAATPKYHLLWKALAMRGTPRRAGR